MANAEIVQRNQSARLLELAEDARGCFGVAHGRALRHFQDQPARLHAVGFEAALDIRRQIGIVQ
jgi:hypothetical protein